MRRFLVNALALVAALLALIGLSAYAYLRRSLPATDGVVSVAGVSAMVEIVRDADAVPHIFAATKSDALFGLGYAHAQDRLWQMEFQRRIGFGRLSEILGPLATPQDRFLRTIGYGRAARSAWATLPDSARRDVNAYVAGVNAFIAAHRGSRLPPEFTLLRIEPEPFDGADVMVWGKMIAWDLSGNYSYELLRHDLIAKVGAERTAELLPPYPVDGLSILSERDLTWLPRSYAARDFSRASHDAAAQGASAIQGASKDAPYVGSSIVAAFIDSVSTGDPTVARFLLGGATEGLGSNNWVVDGTRTASGYPLLANDPHLATRIPSIWYLAHLSAGDFDVIGATFPGTPVVAIGRNRSIAWGATNVGADVEDLYREKLDPTGKYAEFRGVLEPLQIVTETIAVKGRDAVRLDVRISRHGPLVSDALNANSAESPRRPQPPRFEPLALRWTALDPGDTTIAALLRINEARSWDDFTAAFRDFVVPSQNFVYADVRGHIGYYAPGRIPIRAQGDGSAPADGAAGNAEWTGWVPFDQLPHAYDPPAHAIVTANNRPAPPTYPFLLGLEWPEPYRAQRITDLLNALPGTGKSTPADFAAIQADTVSLHARTLLPLLLAHVHPQAAADEEALALLRAWNHDTRGDSGAAAIFEAWFLALAPAIVGDELGPLRDSYRSRFTFITRFVANALAGHGGQWCDDVGTSKRETCDEAVSAALHDAVVDLTRRLGGDLRRWRWEAVHPAIFPHQGLDTVAALRPLLSRSVPSAGDWSTVDVGAVAWDRPFEQRNAVSYRQIIDLSPQNDSRFLDALGQSGHPLSKHYDDFLADWKAVKHRRMRIDRADVENGATGRLRLLPR